jgi:hypothetical protein
MPRYTLALAVLVVAVAAGLGYWRLRPARTAAAADEPAGPRGGQSSFSRPIVGTASCAGRSCHGGLEPANRADCCWLDEHTTWVSQDPHAGAYRGLEGKRAGEIAARLGIGKAYESNLCLPCHTNPAAALPGGDLVGQERTAGVGCEACHGGATRWIDAHLKEEWKQLDAAAKQRDYGMVALNDPEELARACAGCHVGAPPVNGGPARDVNHDLIAAGHPRLAFEMGSFFANLPRHWKKDPGPEGPRWAVGQLVAAEAALALLQHRAAAGDSPWPEFAEYDCFGCHHNLIPDGWRQKRSPADRRLSSLAWGSWYFSLPRVLAADRVPRLDQLACLLERPLPPRTDVGPKVAEALKEMRSLVVDARKGLSDTSDFARAQMRSLLKNERLQKEAGWDAAEQTYLALWTLSQAAGDKGYQKRLVSLLGDRAFPPGWDGPRSLPKGGFEPGEFLRKLR